MENREYPFDEIGIWSEIKHEIIEKYGTEEQKKYYMPRFAESKEIISFAITLVVTVIYKFMTNQKKMKEMKEQIKDYHGITEKTDH